MFLVRLTIEGEHYGAYERSDARLKLAGLIAFIKQNYQQDISLSMLAQQMNITEQHLNRIFKKEFQMTPLEYLMRYRLLKPRNCSFGMMKQRQMKSPKLSVLTVQAILVPYSKKFEGLSPIELRKRYQS